jgi:hypothetical protein
MCHVKEKANAVTQSLLRRFAGPLTEYAFNLELGI